MQLFRKNINPVYFNLWLIFIFTFTTLINSGFLNAFNMQSFPERVTIRTRLYNTYIMEASVEKFFGGKKKYYHIKSLDDGNFGLYINIETKPVVIVNGPRDLDKHRIGSILRTGELDIFKGLFKKIIYFEEDVSPGKRVKIRKYLAGVFSKYIYRPGILEFIFRESRLVKAYINNIRITKSIRDHIKAHSNSRAQKVIEDYLLALPYLPVLKKCVRDNVSGNNFVEIRERMIFALWLTFLESNFNPYLSGLANEGGIVQVIPELARYLDISMPDYDRYLLYPGMPVKVWDNAGKIYIPGLVLNEGIETGIYPIITHGEIYKKNDEYLIHPGGNKQLGVYRNLAVVNHSTGETGTYTVSDLVSGKKKLLIKIGPGEFIEQHADKGFVLNNRLYTWFLPCPEPGIDDRLDPLVMLKVFGYIFGYMNTLENYDLSPLKRFVLSIIYFNNGPGFSEKLWERYKRKLLSIKSDNAFIEYIKNHIPYVTRRYINSFNYLYNEHKNHEKELNDLAVMGEKMWRSNYFDLEKFYQGRNGQELKLIALERFNELSEYDKNRNILSKKHDHSKKEKSGSMIIMAYFPYWFKYNYEIDELIERIKGDK